MEDIAHGKLATDVAAEMSVLLKQFDLCKTCHKACSAAVEMLGVKHLLNVEPFAHEPSSISAIEFQEPSTTCHHNEGN